MNVLAADLHSAGHEIVAGYFCSFPSSLLLLTSDHSHRLAQVQLTHSGRAQQLKLGTGADDYALVWRKDYVEHILSACENDTRSTVGKTSFSHSANSTKSLSIFRSLAIGLYLEFTTWPNLQRCRFVAPCSGEWSEIAADESLC